jgi:hypothetical protein
MGEGERVAFWRDFLPQIVGSIPTVARDAVFIVFKKWFAVEFVSMGRATYMFPLGQLKRLSKLSGYTLYNAVLTTPAIGSFKHQGINWQGRLARPAGHLVMQRFEHLT